MEEGQSGGALTLLPAQTQMSAGPAGRAGEWTVGAAPADPAGSAGEPGAPPGSPFPPTRAWADAFERANTCSEMKHLALSQREGCELMQFAAPEAAPLVRVGL